MKLYYYDLETFINCFLFAGKFEGDPKIYLFEISDRKNERDALMSHLSYVQNCEAMMVGFNNLAFDCPVLQELLMNPHTFDARKAYLKAQEIIGSQRFGEQPQLIPLRERLIPQIDLLKINHFDNANKKTSLKALQFAMRSQSVEDLPYSPHEPLTFEQMDNLGKYNIHDLTETELFGAKCKHLIQMRQELLNDGTLTGDVLNYSDVKIGTEFLIRKIGRSKCYVSGNKPRRTIRESVRFADVILPKISYRTEPFNEVLEWFKKQTLWIGKKNENPKLEAKLANLQFHFGLGGVHASVNDRYYESNETHVIKDIDVSGMYVAVAIANGFAPEHLGQDFITAYRQLQRDRAQYPKGSTMNAVLKLAGNGVYGNSNNVYSPFYDPKYTFTVTSNGQLQLIQLVELLALIPGLEIIQANTDGITALVPRQVEPFFHLWKKHWEDDTFLKLEEVEYTRMWIRDVNNYIAIDTKGKVKRKGAYWYPENEKEYEGWWNKDFSNLSAQKGVEQVLVNDWNPDAIVRVMSDPFDFMMRYKTTAGSKVYIGNKEMPKTVRYYVSKAGAPMKKISTPKGAIGDYKRKNSLSDSEYEKVLASIPVGSWDERIHTKNKSKYEMTTTAIESGWLVKECNNASNFNWADVDYDYYSAEIRKLIVGQP